MKLFASNVNFNSAIEILGAIIKHKCAITIKDTENCALNYFRLCILSTKYLRSIAMKWSISLILSLMKQMICLKASDVLTDRIFFFNLHVNGTDKYLILAKLYWVCSRFVVIDFHHYRAITFSPCEWNFNQCFVYNSYFSNQWNEMKLT